MIGGPSARRLAVLVALSCLARWLSVVVPIFNGDEAAHAVGSWIALDGGALYVDYVDNKPPLLYVFYGLSQLLLGRGLIAVHLVTMLALVPLTALGLSAFYRHDRRGLVAAAAYVLFASAAHDGAEMMATNGELVMALPAAWALALVAGEVTGPGRLIGCGALLGLAILCKQQAASWLPVVPLAVLLGAPPPGRWGRALRATGWLALGTALPLAAVAAWFAAGGRLGALVDCTVVSIAGYLDQGPGRHELLGRLAKVSPIALTTLGLWFAAARSLRHAPQPHPARLLGLAIACSLAGVSLGGRFFPHYFIQVLVPLCLAAAPAAADALARRGGRRWLAYPAVVLVGATAINVVLYCGEGRADVHDEVDPARARVAAWLARDACHAGASLFVWGQDPILYYLTALPPASRFVLPQGSISGYVPGNAAVIHGRVSVPGLISEQDRAVLLDDLARTPPTYVLDLTDAGFSSWARFPLTGFPALAARLERDHERVARVDGVQIWRRRGCAAEARGMEW